MSAVAEAWKLVVNLGRILMREDRAGSLSVLNEAADWHLGSHLPTKSLKDLVGDNADADMTVSATKHGFELPLGEKAALMALVRHCKPELLFEMGTFTGATTVSLARAAGSVATVHTIDLPDEEIVWNAEFKGSVGCRLVERTLNDAAIVSHRVNTKAFNFTPFERRIDFIYIDASHAYEDVLHDSNVALRIVRPGGTIVWDDYKASTPGVARCLRELAQRHPVFNIELTRLAYLKVE